MILKRIILAATLAFPAAVAATAAAAVVVADSVSVSLDQTNYGELIILSDAVSTETGAPVLSDLDVFGYIDDPTFAPVLNIFAATSSVQPIVVGTLTDFAITSAGDLDLLFQIDEDLMGLFNNMNARLLIDLPGSGASPGANIFTEGATASLTPAPIPVPASLALMLAGLGCIGWLRFERSLPGRSRSCVSTGAGKKKYRWGHG
jgi:hypothetical protein